MVKKILHVEVLMSLEVHMYEISGDTYSQKYRVLLVTHVQDNWLR